MGTICILFGIIIFLASLFGGFSLAGLILPLAPQYSSIIPQDPFTLYAICIGVIGFIGLLICLNLVMLGWTFNKVSKLQRRAKHR